MTEIHLLDVPGEVAAQVVAGIISEEDKGKILKSSPTTWMQKEWGLTGEEAESAWWGVLSVEYGRDRSAR